MREDNVHMVIEHVHYNTMKDQSLNIESILNAQNLFFRAEMKSLMSHMT